MFDYFLSTVGLDELLGEMAAAPAALDAALPAILATAGGEIRAIYQDALRAAAPVGKGPTAGRLRDSLSAGASVVGTELVVTATSSAPETPFVIEGTAPHEIRAKNARALAFEVGGELVFATSVHHPGTKANPFQETAYAAAYPRIQAALALVGEEIALALLP